jgi:predicted site-specific integrase-resolvase
MKLSVWAKQQGIGYRAAWNLYKSGGLPNAYQLTNGTIIVREESVAARKPHTVVYARVSSSENKVNLESQADRVSQFCVANGWIISEIVNECASGLNDQRPKLTKILQERKATRIVIEHKDRLTRFGFHFIKVLYPECEIVVINEVKEDTADQMQDFISLVTCFTARLYGRRRTKRSVEKLIAQLQSDKVE